MQLKTLDHPLLGDQYIIQCLDGVILKGQAAFKIGNAFFQRSWFSPPET
ncbi:UNVERIFIED_ORG: CxxC motif-containing protein (DUF1111 family) [Pseudomonas reinekei]|nr:CxxC motif-containing protein (DUF1111 family) [Pseudomonas reinekei]